MKKIKNDMKVIGKRGQIAMWAIIAIALAASIMLFLLVNRKPIIEIQSITSPESFIEECSRQSVIKNTEIILSQGGLLEPKNYKLYKKTKIEYLCDQTADFKNCVNQHPGLIEEITSQLQREIHKKTDECFLMFKEESERNKANVELGEQKTEISLGKNRVFIKITRLITITKEDKRTFENFNYEIINPIYDLSRVALEITNQEAQYCSFDSLGYNIYEPRFSIKKKLFSDGTSIYTINDKKYQKTMSIAIRSCVIPPGTILPEG